MTQRKLELIVEPEMIVRWISSRKYKTMNKKVATV